MTTELFLTSEASFVLAAVATLAPHALTCALQHASAEVRDDKNFVLAVFDAHPGQCVRVLREVATRLRADKELILAAVALDGGALRYASAELKGDAEVTAAAAAQNGYVLDIKALTLAKGYGLPRYLGIIYLCMGAVHGRVEAVAVPACHTKTRLCAAGPLLRWCC